MEEAKPLTALSPYVKRLITEVGVHNGSSHFNLISSIGQICWENLKLVIPDSSNETDTAEYFEECIYGLGFLFKQCKQYLERMTENEFIHQYNHLIQWTGQQKVIIECFRLHQTDQPTDNYLSLLLITSCLERALGDVYLLENTICPSMLKDILSSSTLKKIFGPTVIQVLRAVIGPPISLNLRNVIWHGFPSELEICKRYTSFFILVTSSLNQFINHPVPHRQPVEFPQDNQFTDILPVTYDIKEEDLTVLLKSSNFIQPYQLSLWKSAVHLYYRGQYGMMMVLTLPLLEHSLRCLFTSVNHCPDRTVTAESTTLYTTLDEILGQFVTDDQVNQLPSEIGLSVMDIILDLLTYPTGPRLRDKLSHGEADVFTVPKSLCTTVLLIVTYLSAKYVKLSLSLKPWLDRITNWSTQYETMYHPISLVKSKIKRVVKLTGEFNKHIELTYNLEPRTLWIVDEIIDSDCADINKVSIEIPILSNLLFDKLNVSHPVTNIITQLFSPFTDGSVCICDLLNTKIQTLYRYQKDSGTGNMESEIVNLLLRIGAECETVVIQVFTALQTRQDELKNKFLRSRQRNNLQSLIKSCFILQQCMHFIILLITCYLVTIETKKDHNKSHIKCLKMVLQYTENLRTFTNSENNKWKECVNISLQTLEKLKSMLS